MCGRSDFVNFLALATALVLAGCALPWRDYPVSPAISGRLVRADAPVAGGRVRLQVRSVDNATLGAHDERELPEHGGFFFDPVSLRVAGQEYGKSYVALLYWIPDDGPARTLWRADYSRRELGGPIELICDLERPELKGPPCRFVGDALDQPWLMEAGARDYRALCLSCHGSEGRGDGPASVTLAKPAPDLTRIAARRGGVFPYDEMAAWIDGRGGSHGQREMPVWGVVLSDQYVPGGFTEARIRNRVDILVEYLHTLQEL